MCRPAISVSDSDNRLRYCISLPRSVLDAGIGIHPRNPRCYFGFPSRLDRKGEKANWVGEGFWICALGACDYFSGRKDGVPYEDAKCWMGVVPTS